jgi:integrase
MSSIRSRKDNGLLFFDFRFKGKRCREQTMLSNTVRNQKRLEKILDQIDAEITLGTFDYRRFFPSSNKAAHFDAKAVKEQIPDSADTPLFKDFADTWWSENEIRWRRSTRLGNQAVLKRHLLPTFADFPVGEITKAEVLAFRAEVAQCAGRSGNATLSPKTINNLMGVLSMIMTEAADRFEFSNPMRNVKRLRLRRKDIQPFSLDEVRLIRDTVRSDYRNYFTLRFFTGHALIGTPARFLCGKPSTRALPTTPRQTARSVRSPCRRSSRMRAKRSTR